MQKNQTCRLAIIAVAALASLGLAGCASIVSGNTQSLSVKTLDKADQELAGGKCSLTNDKGVWYLTTPGSVTVHRSYADLVVACEAPDQEPGSTRAPSSTKAMAFGNILIGGVIGAGVDVATGAAYDYPQQITVSLGRRIDLATTPATAASAPATTGSAPMATTTTTTTTVAAAVPATASRTYTLDATAGAERVLHAHASFNGNCTQRPDPRITVVEAPKNGTITVRHEPIVITEGYNSSKCDGMTFDGSRVYYKANDDFHGTEQLAYRYDTGLSSGEVRVTVNVH